MRLPRFCLLTLLLAATLPCASAAQDEITFKNAGLTRTVSAAAGIIKTKKLEANGVQMLDGPSVEFMLELQHKGTTITLVPSDFDVKEVNAITRGNETNTYVRLDSHADGIPLTIHVNYYHEPKLDYQQKSITVLPCKKPEGAVLKRVVIEDMMLRSQFRPVTPYDPLAATDSRAEAPADVQGRFRFDRSSDFAALDPKSNKGLFFFVNSAVGTESCSRGGNIVMAENLDVPLEKGYESGRATIGTAAGPPEVLYKRFREFLWNSCAAKTGKPGTSADQSPRPSFSYSQAHRLSQVERLSWSEDQNADPLALRRRLYLRAFVFPPRTMGYTPADALLAQLGEKHPRYFEVYQHVLALPDGGSIDGEAHILDNKGFIMLRNPSASAQKVALPLNEPELELKGTLKLTDAGETGTAAELATAKPGDTIEIELGPGATRVIGVNM